MYVEQITMTTLYTLLRFYYKVTVMRFFSYLCCPRGKVALNGAPYPYVCWSVTSPHYIRCSKSESRRTFEFSDNVNISYATKRAVLKSKLTAKFPKAALWIDILDSVSQIFISCWDFLLFSNDWKQFCALLHAITQWILHFPPYL